jgi:hypothetical protein
MSRHEMNSPTIIEQELRLCGKCCRALPVSEFRRRSKSSESRSSDCRACHNHYEHARLEKGRNQVRRRIVRKAADDVSRCRTIEEAAEVIRMIPAAFGGAENLCQFWFDEVRRGDRPNELIKFCQLWFEFEKLQYVAQVQRQNRLGTPEYAAEMEKDLQELVRNNPEIVAEALQRISGAAACSGAGPQKSDF